MADLPATAQSIVANLAAQSVRVDTPCGEGALAWRRWGNGPPILLLHGSHGSWMHWIRNIPHLCKSRTVWVPDIPGFGESALPAAKSSIEAVAAALCNGLTALAIKGPLDVVGFSFGGTVGAHLAVQARDRIRKLVLVDSGGLGTPMPPIRTVPVRRDGDATEAHRHNLLAMMIYDPTKLDALALYVQALHVPLARLDVREMVLPDRLARALERSHTPVDAIWGEYDRPHPDPGQQLSALRRVRPTARMRIVADAGHWSIYENAPGFHAHLDALLSPTG